MGHCEVFLYSFGTKPSPTHPVLTCKVEMTTMLLQFLKRSIDSIVEGRTFCLKINGCWIDGSRVVGCCWLINTKQAEPKMNKIDVLERPSLWRAASGRLARHVCLEIRAQLCVLLPSFFRTSLNGNFADPISGSFGFCT